MSFDFRKISNFRLAAGSHDQPNEYGDICINEAAIIAAGFEYKKVDKAEDCPPCFSRVLSSYALQLNDKMPDDLRQKLLMPFVTRLAGTADTPEIELQRAQFITVGLIRRVVSIPLRNWKPDLAAKFEVVETVGQAQAAIKDLALEIFEVATQILDDAMLIGKRAEPIETVLVETRIEAIKALSA